MLRSVIIKLPRPFCSKLFCSDIYPKFHQFILPLAQFMLKMKRFSIFAFICKAKRFAIACNSSSKYFSWYWYVGLYIQLLLSIRKMIRPFRGAIQIIQLSWENIYDINAKIRQTFSFVVITNKLLIYYFIYFFYLLSYLTILLVLEISYQRVLACLTEGF